MKLKQILDDHNAQISFSNHEYHVKLEEGFTWSDTAVLAGTLNAEHTGTYGLPEEQLMLLTFKPDEEKQ